MVLCLHEPRYWRRSTHPHLASEARHLGAMFTPLTMLRFRHDEEVTL